jgi:hypothetical protein
MVLITMGWMVGSGDPYVGGHHLVATAEVICPPACAPTPGRCLSNDDCD